MKDGPIDQLHGLQLIDRLDSSLNKVQGASLGPRMIRRAMQIGESEGLFCWLEEPSCSRGDDRIELGNGIAEITSRRTVPLRSAVLSRCSGWPQCMVAAIELFVEVDPIP
jgi:hypothetical protein